MKTLFIISTLLLSTGLFFSQSSISDAQMLGMINGGYANVKSYEHHTNKGKSTNTQRQVTQTKTYTSSSSTQKKASNEKMSGQQLEYMLNNGINVNSPNARVSKSYGPGGPKKTVVTIKKSSQPNLPQCTQQINGRNVMSSTYVYTCRNGKWYKS